MARRRVLIVDDSKTAQIRLRKMLEKFDLEVDTALSAEEALGYLSYRHPAIIFLDHHMEGMDGLEALKIIKSNPGTALIPVIMYTSQQGDVYVGQARALGAIDILSKEVMKHANLEKVLTSLGIDVSMNTVADDDHTLESSGHDVQVIEEPLIPSVLNDDDSLALSDSSHHEPSSDLEQIQKQVSRLFEIHIAKVRQEIEDSTKFLLRRLSKDALDKSKPTHSNDVKASTPATPSPLPLGEAFDLESMQEKSNLSSFLIGLILLGIAFLGYHLYINNERQALLNRQFFELAERARAQETLINRLFTKISKVVPDKEDQNLDNGRQLNLDVLSWAVNADTQIDFNETALNLQKMYLIRDLLSLLNASNFEGSMFIDVHLGNFCVLEDPNVGWRLPNPESALDDCVFLAAKMGNVSVNDQMSVEFANFLQSSASDSNGKIQIEPSSLGYSSPRYTYPPNLSTTNAGDWNKVAQKNNRIGLSFAPK